MISAVFPCRGVGISRGRNIPPGPVGLLGLLLSHLHTLVLIPLKLALVPLSFFLFLIISSQTLAALTIPVTRALFSSF